MNKLKLTPAASLTKNEHGILLQSDLGTFQLHGKDITAFIDKVLPLLQGQHTSEEICRQLPEYGSQSIGKLLNLLISKGLVEEQLLTENASSMPYWQAQERFLKAYGVQQDDSGSLGDKKVLIIGLEPWSMNIAAELARTGVGYLHLLDSGQLNEEDLLCIRTLTSEQLGQPRALAYQQSINAESPWCRVSSEALEIDDEAGLKVADDQWDLVVIALANDEQFRLKATADYIQEHELTALYGSLDGVESWVGPLVTPGESACWNCLRLRQLGNADTPTAAHDIDSHSLSADRDSRARSLLAPLASVAGSHLAMEAIKILTGFADSELCSTVQVHHLIKGESTRHKIIPMPWCEVCGGPENLRNKNAFLPDWADTSSQSNQQFAAMSAVADVSAGQVINPLNLVNSVKMVRELFTGWVDDKFGVIKTLTGHNSQLPALPVTASAYVSAFTEGKFDMRTMGQVGAGKGLDEISAHIGAVGEALERYSAARYRKQQMLYSGIDGLTGEFIDPDDLVLYSKAQYRDPNFLFSAWNKKQKIHWAKGVWLGTDRPVWVPSLVTYFNFDCSRQELFSQASSNGLAAGQGFDDAAMRATYELIERDAMMLTWYAQLPGQRLSMASVTDTGILDVIENITGHGVSLELYLLDMGTGIPTVVCLGFGDGIHNPATSVSLATHAEIQVALHKAILEQGHVLPYLRSLMTNQHGWPRHVQQVQSLEDHAKYYFAKDKQQHFDFMRQPENQAILAKDWQGADIKNIQDLRQCLENAGLQVAVVDVTSPDMQLSPFTVVRAVGPHIQPIHFGEQFKRVDNPRLRKLLQGRPPNSQPHPIA